MDENFVSPVAVWVGEVSHNVLVREGVWKFLIPNQNIPFIFQMYGVQCYIGMYNEMCVV